MSGYSGVTGYGSLVRVKFVSAATEATGITFSTSDVGYHIAAYNSGIDPIHIGGAYNILDLTAPIGVWPGDTNNNDVVNYYCYFTHISNQQKISKKMKILFAF